MIEQLLKDILEYCGYTSDEDGLISIALYKEDKPEPAIIKGKRMVLPTQYHLANPSPEKIIFYPLKENILHGESDVVAELREKLIVKLNISISNIMSNLLLLASGTNRKSLKPHQFELISLLPEVTTETAKAFTKFFTSYVKSNNNNTNVFINIYLKKGGTHKERKFSCVGIVSFPFYEELIKGTHPSVAKLNKKDRASIIKLAEWMFTNIKTPEEYNHGSVNPNCRHLDALLMTTANVASRLNDICEDYGDYIFIDDEDGSDRKTSTFNGDWMDALDNPEVGKKILLIPMQNGNEGSKKITEPTPEIQPLVTQPAPVAQANSVTSTPTVPVPLPLPTPTPVQAPAKKTFDFASANRQPAPAQPALVLVGHDLTGQPIYQPAPVQQPAYNQPVHQPVHQQQQPYYPPQQQQQTQYYQQPYPNQQQYPAQNQYGQQQYHPQVDAFGRPLQPNNGYQPNGYQQQPQQNSRMPNGWPTPPQQNSYNAPYRRNPY